MVRAVRAEIQMPIADTKPEITAATTAGPMREVRSTGAMSALALRVASCWP